MKTFPRDYHLATNDLQAEMVRDLFIYDPDTGVFRHRVRRSNACRANGIAGSTSTGRLLLNIVGKTYLGHRIAWLWMIGSWPEKDVDHKDGDTLNNRWENLRVVTGQLNVHNIHRAPNRKRYSPLLGAHWCKQINRWKSSILVDGRRVHLGVFASDEAASKAYIEAKLKYHQGFSCTQPKESPCALLS